VLAFFAGYACRIARWRLMLVQENPALAWRDCAGPLMASVAANNVLPLRAGDLLRAFGFNRQLGISAATSLATLFVERLLDLLMVVLLLGAALAWFGMASSTLVGAGGGLLVAAGLAILAVLLFPRAFRPLADACCRLAARVLPGLGRRLEAEAGKVFAALEHAAGGSTMPRLLAWSLLAWLGEGLVFWLVALALPALTAPAAAWLALPVGTLATAIPSTPGFVGTFDFFTARAMTLGGNAAAASAAFAFLVHAVLWLPPTVAGGLYLLSRHLRPGPAPEALPE
jgi:uncharacterized protein (TIRG00374 family)